jgi:hypothetical protein
MPDTTFISIHPHILGGTPVFWDAFPSVSRELAQGVLQEAKQAVVHAHAA